MGSIPTASTNSTTSNRAPGASAKVELGLARGRKTLDKRHAIREREERREMDRAIRARTRG